MSHICRRMEDGTITPIQSPIVVHTLYNYLIAIVVDGRDNLAIN